MFQTVADNEKPIRLLKFEQIEKKNGKETIEEWNLIKEATVECPEDGPEEEVYRKSMWIKGKKLICITNERCLVFNEELEQLKASQV